MRFLAVKSFFLPHSAGSVENFFHPILLIALKNVFRRTLLLAVNFFSTAWSVKKNFHRFIFFFTAIIRLSGVLTYLLKFTAILTSFSNFSRLHLDPGCECLCMENNFLVWFYIVKLVRYSALPKRENLSWCRKRLLPKIIQNFLTKRHPCTLIDKKNGKSLFRKVNSNRYPEAKNPVINWCQTFRNLS